MKFGLIGFVIALASCAEARESAGIDARPDGKTGVDESAEDMDAPRDGGSAVDGGAEDLEAPRDGGSAAGERADRPTETTSLCDGKDEVQLLYSVGGGGPVDKAYQLTNPGDFVIDWPLPRRMVEYVGLIVPPEWTSEPLVGVRFTDADEVAALREARKDARKAERSRRRVLVRNVPTGDLYDLFVRDNLPEATAASVERTLNAAWTR